MTDGIERVNHLVRKAWDDGYASALSALNRPHGGPNVTQTEALLDFLRERGEQGVTPIEALNLLGIFRLAARVSDLRHEGYDIVTDIVRVPTGKHVARYRLIEELTLGFED